MNSPKSMFRCSVQVGGRKANTSEGRKRFLSRGRRNAFTRAENFMLIHDFSIFQTNERCSSGKRDQLAFPAQACCSIFLTYVSHAVILYFPASQPHNKSDMNCLCVVVKRQAVNVEVSIISRTVLA